MLLLNRKHWLALLAAAAFAVTLPYLFELVNRLGYQIPVLDRGNDFSKGVILAALLALALVVAPVSQADRRNLLFLWGAKAAVSLVIMLFYEWNYGLDAFWYFERSQKQFPDFAELGLGNGSNNLTAALWFIEHKIISLGSFHSQKVLCSFAGLGAVYLFYRGLAAQVPNLAPRTLLYIGLFPSVLFWGSILGKDPLNLLGICLFFYGVLSFLKAMNPVYLFPAAAGLALAALMRTWLVPMLIIPFLIGGLMRIQTKVLRGLAIALVVAGVLYGLSQSSALIVAENTEIVSQVNSTSRAWARGGSAGSIPVLDSPAAMVKFLPIGIFTALFRPLPGEILNPFGLLAGLENALILFLLVLSIKRPARNAWAQPVVVIMGSFILIWSLAYAFISPQNLGSAVRFRLQVMPMLVFMLLYIPKAIRPRVILSPRERRNSTGNT